MELSKRIADWIKNKVEKSGKKGIIVGLSGGVDSAVCAVLAKKALGDNTLALILPCESNPEDIALAEELAGKFNIKTERITLDKAYNEIVKLYPAGSDLAKANLKPRLRMLTLYYFANTLDCLVAGTGNRSELAIGYFTKYGDGGVDILPIGGLLKTEVKKLAKELGIPEAIIKRPPTAGLWHGQTDEGEIGITYDELDKAIAAIDRKKTQDMDKDMLQKVKKMMVDSEHKRRKIPLFEK